ncbi:hypothetical protein AWU67_08435 [Microterricola viridarii]|uniref:Uncharacterized protein n=1 Tax=Microterricola viridarii TaxID=412690 RepID=A0A0X8E1Y0_9MICO|nr:hypothetical protein AWU67_08435 [Microterricola viridarii]
MVTIDKSEVFAGLDRAKFDRNDALFISSALQTDLSVFHSEQVLPSGRTRRASNYRPWQKSIPVAVDAAVLRVFTQITETVRLDSADTESVDRTDLLCAATAIAYGAPLYTTRPEAYAGLKNGLRLLEYRSVRNKSVLRERERAGTVVSIPIATPRRRPDSADVSSPPGAPLDELKAAFERGDPIDERVEALLLEAAKAEGFAEFVSTVLSGFLQDWDPSWRIAILERAEEFLPALAGDDVWHDGIMDYTSQLLTSTPGNTEISLARQTEVAMTALATWGRWPADASDDVLESLPHEPDDESLLTWYWIYLGMAGLSRATIDEEVESVRAGDVLPSRERIERLRGRG